MQNEPKENEVVIDESKEDRTPPESRPDPATIEADERQIPQPENPGEDAHPVARTDGGA